MSTAGMFGTVDLCVFVLCTCTSLAIGIAIAGFGRRQTSTNEYLLGGQKQGFLPAVLSLLVSFNSGILMLGVPAETYVYGSMIAVRIFGELAVMTIFIRVVVPLFYKLKLTSIYQYFGGRFSTMKVRFLMVWIGVITNTCYSGMVLVAPAMVLSPLLGIPDWAIMAIVAALAVTYTSIGGITAVIWTDVFQCLVMVAGLLAVIVQCTIEVGGPGRVIRIASEHGRLDLFDFNPDPTRRHTFWTLNIGSAFLYLMMIFSQQTVQRINATSSYRYARIEGWLLFPLNYALELLACACGLCVFAFYQSLGCDPLAAQLISTPNEILIKAMRDLFHHIPGLTGLFMAALLSASLSTVSSCLNGFAAIFCEDFLKLRWRTMSDRKATTIAKLSVLMNGVVSTAIALTLRFVRGNLAQMFGSIMGSLSGPSAGIFLLSIFCKRTTTLGVYVGGLAGFAMSLWLMLGFNFSPTLPKTPWLPPGPTDRCPVNNSTLGNASYTPLLSVLNKTSVNFTIDTIDMAAMDHSSSAQGLDRLYSVSYMYFTVITTLLTLGVGAGVSLLSPAGTEPPGAGDHVYTMSFTEAFCCCWRKKEQTVRGFGKCEKDGMKTELETQKMIETDACAEQACQL